jgi:hypothetical protein
MVDPAQLETTKATLAKLFADWEARAASYGRFLYGTALVLVEGVWKNVLTFLFPLHRSEVRLTRPVANYGDFIVASGYLDQAQAELTLSRVVDERELHLPGMPSVPLSVTLDPSSAKTFWGSQNPRFPLYYPYHEYRFRISNEVRSVPPQRYLCSVDLPIYPTGQAAIEGELYARLGGFGAYNGELVALVPDYRAKIQTVRLSTKGGEVHVQIPEGGREDVLLAKYYHESFQGCTHQGGLLFAQGKACFEAKDFPRRMIVALLCKPDREVIDEWFFEAGAPARNQGVEFEQSEEDILNLIAAGESENIEFKKEVPSKRNEIAIAVTAFANHRGGRVLIGVDDKAEVVGCSGEKLSDTITNIVREHCDPVPPFSVKSLTVRERQVIVITVPEGEDKPYAVKNKGTYIRSGATSRAANRYELDQIYKDRSGL